jgi:hypothetical protein
VKEKVKNNESEKKFNSDKNRDNFIPEKELNDAFLFHDFKITTILESIFGYLYLLLFLFFFIRCFIFF